MEPFSTPPPDNWTSLIFDLERRIEAVADEGDGFLVLNVDRADDPFVQVVVQPGRSITAEAAATLADRESGKRIMVGSETVGRLVALGWREPTADPLRLAGPEDHPNFYRSWSAADLPVAIFAELLVRTLVEAYQVSDPSEVRVRGGYLTAGVPPGRK